MSQRRTENGWSWSCKPWHVQNVSVLQYEHTVVVWHFYIMSDTLNAAEVCKRHRCAQPNKTATNFNKCIVFWPLPSKCFPIPDHQLPWDSTPEFEMQRESYNKSLNDILYERCTSHCSHSNGKVTAGRCMWQYRLTSIQRPIFLLNRFKLWIT